MKRLAAILICASLVRLSVVPPALGVGPSATPAGYREGITVDKNGMVNPLGTAKAVTFPHGVRVISDNIGISKEIFIAARTDNPDCVSNICGSGTPLDPYDGSTAAKFDAVMQLVESTGAYSTVHIGAGTFLTTGSRSFNAQGYYLPAGIKIIGAGMNKTIIRASAYPVAAAGSGHYIFQMGQSTDGDGAEVSDLTVDSNWDVIKTALTPVSGNYNAKTGGVELAGNNWKIRRVRAINDYGNVAFDTECFPLIGHRHISGGVWQDSKGGEIWDCEADLFKGNYGIALVAGGRWVSTTGNCRGAKVMNSRVYNWTGTCALGAGGDDVEMAGNETYGCDQAIHIDTHNLENAFIHDNKFMDCNIRGIDLVVALAAPYVNNVKIFNNIFEVNRTYGAAAYCINVGSGIQGINHNVEIYNNRFIRKNTGSYPTQVAIGAVYVDGLTISHNVIDSILQATDFHPVVPGNNTHVTLRGNLNELAAVPSGLADTGIETLSVSGQTSLNSASLSSNLTGSSTTVITAHNITAENTVTGDGFNLRNLDVNKVGMAIRSVADTNTTTTAADHLLQYTSLTAARTVTLDDVSKAAKHGFIIKDLAGTAGTNNISISPAIDGATQKVDTNGGAISVYSDGSNFHVLWKK